LLSSRRRWWHWRRRIRVMILPTDTYNVCSLHCDLHAIADRLNRTQRCYRFVVLARRPSRRGKLVRQGVVLEQKTKLQNKVIREAAPKSERERKEAVETYIEEADAYEQLAIHARRLAIQFDEGPVGDDILIAVGSEVLVWDNEDNMFEGDAARDASSLSWMDASDTRIPTTNSLHLQQVAMISLRRLNYIFEEAVQTDNPERARAIAARYIISNLVSFAGNRSFNISLFHHALTGCLNESAWVGGEREAYHVDGYCPCCRKQYEQANVAAKHGDWSVTELLAAIEKMLCEPDKIDDVVRSTQRFLFWAQFGAITIAANIFAASILDIGLRWDWWDQPSEWLSHVKTHDIAYAVAALFFATGISILCSHLWRHAKLP
jgi:hypothetical protein